MLLGNSDKYNYPDDIFEESRMSFGDHLDQLRTRLRLALLGPVIFTILGLVLDGIGAFTGKPYIGMGKPMLAVITDPVSSMVRDFYSKRTSKAKLKLTQAQLDKLDPADGAEILKKFEANGSSIIALSSEERKKLFGAPVEMPMVVNSSEFKGLGLPENQTETIVHVKVYPAYIDYITKLGETVSDNRAYITSLSPQEGMMVYFKVTLLCAIVLSCPWIFYHVWAFVAAGLYPHEKRYVHRFLPFSVCLFLIGVFVCQFIVLPGTVKALLSFNEFIDVDPDLRLNEWLSFAIILPLIFGVSFQTPLVMFVLNRIGLVSVDFYLKKWRMSVFLLAIFSAIITPSPDAYTMLFLFLPMFGLYLLGIGICYWFPPPPAEPDNEDASEVAV
jgi:sec-independent protein translocase protein TatC